MGADIHLFAEKKVYDSKDKDKEKGVWISIDKWTMNDDFDHMESPEIDDLPRNCWWPYGILVDFEDRFYTRGRNYWLFGALCGVRCEVGCPKLSEPKGLPADVCLPLRLESENWGSDAHSHSWNTLAELRTLKNPKFKERYEDQLEDFLEEIERKSELHLNPKWGNPCTEEEIRVVYWYDN